MYAGTALPNRRRWTLLAVGIGAVLSLWLTAASLAISQPSAASQQPDPILHLAGPNHDGGGG
jgi:hypothetical protein